MIQSLAFAVLISLKLISSVQGYDFSLSTCASTAHQQSPINIVQDQSLYFDEKYFRFLTNNYQELTTQNYWSYFTEEMAVGIAPTQNQTDFGSFIFVKDWAMYSFNLKKILFRVQSEHQIDGESFDVEMQLVHTIDANYYTPGRRINLGVDYLVISVFFKKEADGFPGNTKLFDFMNLQGFYNATQNNLSTNAYMDRSIKLHYMIQHQPSYMYTGSLTYPECQEAIWLLFSQFHIISESDLTYLTKVIQTHTPSIVDSTTNYNDRNLFSNTNTPVYRNWNEAARMEPRQNLLVYNSSSFLNLSYVVYISLLFSLLMIIF